MRNVLKSISLFLCGASLLSCTCATPIKVTEIQKTDKKLACKDIILEINEAEHYKDLAKKERGIGFGNMLMPVCWVSSYVDAGGAVKAADERISYLGNIYEVLDCGGKSDMSDKTPSAGPTPPAVIQVQPAQLPPSSPPQNIDQNVKGEVDIDDKMVRNNMHQHVDKYGKVYTHSHPYAGPHKHLDD